MRVRAAAVGLFFLLMPAGAQTVTGMVRNAVTGTPVAGAKVVLQQQRAKRC